MLRTGRVVLELATARQDGYPPNSGEKYKSLQRILLIDSILHLYIVLKEVTSIIDCSAYTNSALALAVTNTAAFVSC